MRKTRPGSAWSTICRSGRPSLNDEFRRPQIPCFTRRGIGTFRPDLAGHLAKQKRLGPAVGRIVTVPVGDGIGPWAEFAGHDQLGIVGSVGAPVPEAVVPPLAEESDPGQMVGKGNLDLDLLAGADTAVERAGVAQDASDLGVAFVFHRKGEFP